MNKHLTGAAKDRGEAQGGPTVHAPGCTYKAAQMASRFLSHPAGIVVTAVAVNSVLHATGLMPAFLGFTRVFTVQGMAGIATDGISKLIGLFGSSDAAAQAQQAINTAVQNAQGFANTASNAANLADAATTLEAAQAAAAQAATAAQSAADIASATPQAKAAADLAAQASTRAAAAVTKLASSGTSAFTWVAAFVGTGFVANTIAHRWTEGRMPEWVRNISLQGMFNLVRGLCNRNAAEPQPEPQPQPEPEPEREPAGGEPVGGHGGDPAATPEPAAEPAAEHHE